MCYLLFDDIILAFQLLWQLWNFHPKYVNIFSPWHYKTFALFFQAMFFSTIAVCRIIFGFLGGVVWTVMDFAINDSRAAITGTD